MTKPVASKKFGVLQGCDRHALTNASTQAACHFNPTISNTNDMQKGPNVRMAPERICPGFG